MSNVDSKNRNTNKYLCRFFSNIDRTNNWEKVFLNFNNKKSLILVDKIWNKKTTDDEGNLVEKADLLFLGSLFFYIYKINRMDFYIKNDQDFFILHSLLKKFNLFIKEEFFQYTLEIESNMLELIISIFQQMEFDLNDFDFDKKETRTKKELKKIQEEYKKYKISYLLLHQKPMDEYFKYIKIFIKNKDKFINNKKIFEIISVMEQEINLIRDAIIFRNINNHSNFLYDYLNPLYLRNFSFNEKNLNDFIIKRKTIISILRQTKKQWNWENKIKEFKENQKYFKYQNMKGFNEHILSHNLNLIFIEIKFLIYEFNWNEWEKKEIELSNLLNKGDSN